MGDDHPNARSGSSNLPLQGVWPKYDDNDEDDDKITFVDRLLESRVARIFVFLVWTVLLGCGVVWGLKFMTATQSVVSPASGSLSDLAQKAHDLHFPPETQSIIVVVESANTSSLLLPSNDCRSDFSTFSTDFTSYMNKKSTTTLKGCYVTVLNFCSESSYVRDLLLSQTFDKTHKMGLVAVTANNGCKGDDFAQAVLDGVTDSLSKAGKELTAEATGGPALMLAVRAGVQATMSLSTMTFPFALILVAMVVQNIRMVFLIIINIVASLLTSFLIMYPIALQVNVTSMTPSLMIAAILAMSIDYSLFLLSRFRDEIQEGKPVDRAVSIMLRTSGRIVLISGLTLTICFLTMLLLPCTFISTMGVGASVAVFLAILANLTITPMMFMTFPSFFSSFRRYGFSLDNCCTDCKNCCSGREKEDSLDNFWDKSEGDVNYYRAIGNGNNHQRSARAEIKEDYRKSKCKCLATATQKFGVIIIVVIFAIAAPVIAHIPELGFSEGIIPMMPRDYPSTDALINLMDKKGASVVFSTDLLMLPPKGTLVSDPKWLNESCSAIKHLSSVVPNSTIDQFSGIMLMDGYCVPPALVDLALESNSELSKFLCDEIETKACNQTCVAILEELHINQTSMCGKVCDYLNKSFDGNETQCEDAVSQAFTWEIYKDFRGIVASKVSGDRKAASVSIKLAGDPFNSDGQTWIKAWRNEADAYKAHHPLLGQMYLIGEGPVQMDTAEAVFKTFPLMIGVTIGIVFTLLCFAFKSFVIPLRAVLCLSLMLGASFGVAICVYQHGALDFLGVQQLAKSESGSMNWMTPMISFSVMVGLGLDYDVFLMESIAEERRSGLSDSEAVMSGLCQTGNIISIAGVVMLVAFISLLISATPALNQIAFLLLFGIIIDCFVTTKLIIPSAMAMLGKLNFWPQKLPITRHIAHDPDDDDPALSNVPAAFRIFCCCMK